MNILSILEKFLDNRNLFVRFGQEKFIPLQLTLINAIHYTFKHHYSMADNIDSSMESMIKIDDYRKIIQMFHSLETIVSGQNLNLNERKIPPLYH
ncbi:hypothetical protein BLA29_012461, partial [Euroglyphus maynei]